MDIEQSPMFCHPVTVACFLFAETFSRHQININLSDKMSFRTGVAFNPLSAEIFYENSGDLRGFFNLKS